MTSAPKISILTATHNSLSGLQRTSQSIDSQSFRDFEHIVIDGGSTDGSKEWLVGHSGRIRWVSEPDFGIADALNKGLRMATGEWILVLHSEDTLIDESALSVASEELQNLTDIVSFDVLFITNSEERRWRSRGLSPKTNFKTTIPHQGAFCRRAIFERLGPFDTRFRIALDYEFFLRAYRAKTPTRVVNQVIARMPDTGVSSRGDWLSLSQRFGEERAIQRLHVESQTAEMMYAVYWAFYMPYRRIRYSLQQGWGIGVGA